MAFVSRAERDSKFTNPSNSNIGPGSYHSPSKKTLTSYAPFASTLERSISTQQKSVSPGPGRYNLFPVAKKQSSTIASRASRFNPCEESTTPGPGSYNVMSPLKKTSFQRRPVINYIKNVSSPSIPTKEQVFGYGISETGDLLIQKNPYKIYTGEKSNSIGPGHYEVQVRSRMRGPVWYKPERAEKEVDDSPGPGTYSLDNIAKGLDKKVLSSRLSPAFASNTKRPTFVPKSDSDSEEDTSPGPGYYYDAQNYSSFPQKTTKNQKQSFGSKSVRFVPSIYSDMGPGYYGSHKKPKRTFVVNVPFASTMKRFDNAKELSPGPGSYNENSDHKKTWGKYGVFGSTEKRFANNQTDLPGPGHYDCDHPNDIRSKQSAVFASNVSRDFKPINSEYPAPGNYETSKGISTANQHLYTDKRTHKEVGFDSQTKRFVQDSFLNKYKIGPGTYDPIQPEKINQFNISNVFISSSHRFPDQKKKQPGPGSYKEEDHWDKKSFNVLFNS